MRPIHKHIIFILLLSSTNLFSQKLIDQKETDSLLEVYRRTIYEAPNDAIQFALKINNTQNESIENKTRALILISLAYNSKRDYQKALKYINEAHNISSQINDPLLKIEILFRKGILYQQVKLFDNSLKVLDEVERLCLNNIVKEEAKYYLGNTYLAKGFIYKDNLNCDIALNFFERGIQQYLKIQNIPYYNNLSVAYYNSGNCYKILSDYEKSKQSFETAINYAQVENASSLSAFAKKGLAEVYTLEGRYNNAIDLLSDALEQSKDVGDLILYQGIYLGLFENYLALDNWKQYQKYHNLYLKTEQKVKISERESISDSIKENFKSTEEQKRQLVKTNKNKIIVVVVSTFLLTFFGLFLEQKNRKAIKNLKTKVDIIKKNEQ